MKNKKDVSEYFSVNAEAWLDDAYEQSGYNYPTPQHRVRIIKDFLGKTNSIKSVLDVGCGDGTLAVTLAREGLNVLGIDQSEKMLNIAKSELEKQSEEIRSRITYKQQSLELVKVTGYDALTAMGVIGYLENDEVLFDLASKVLREKGYFIVSFRNRLFNLFSVSHRTINEATDGSFPDLVEEASDLYQKVDKNLTLQFLKQLHEVTGQLIEGGALDVEAAESPSMKKGNQYVSGIEARQTTPGQAVKIASEFGFETRHLYGVHPHFSVPGLNNLLPPQVYNRLSDSLISLENTPVGLLWSSAFIGVFQKK